MTQADRLFTEEISSNIQRAMEIRNIETYGNRFWDYLEIEEVGLE